LYSALSLSPFPPRSLSVIANFFRQQCSSCNPSGCTVMDAIVVMHSFDAHNLSNCA
jgi:hypothetical protein